mgnify:FL=1
MDRINRGSPPRCARCNSDTQMRYNKICMNCARESALNKQCTQCQVFGTFVTESAFVTDVCIEHAHVDHDELYCRNTNIAYNLKRVESKLIIANDQIKDLKRAKKELAESAEHTPLFGYVPEKPESDLGSIGQRNIELTLDNMNLQKKNSMLTIQLGHMAEIIATQINTTTIIPDYPN